MGILKRAFVKTAELLHINLSELWIPAGFYFPQSTKFSVAQPNEIANMLVDTIASCVNKRSEYRSAVDASFKGASAVGPMVESMFFRSQDFTTQSEFVSLCSQDLDVFGNSFWYLNLADRIFQRWDPQTVEIDVKQYKIVSYRPRSGGEAVPARLIFHFKRTNILNRAMVGRAIVDEVLGLMNSNLAFNAFFARYLETDGVPRATVEFPKDSVLTPEQIKAMEIAYDAKFNKANQSAAIGWLFGGGTLKKQSPSEFDFLKSYDVVQQSIRDSCGTPKIIFGNTDHVNFSNGLTSYLIFLEAVVHLFHRKLSDELSYFFQQNKLNVQITYTSRIDTSGLLGLTGGPKGVTKQVNEKRVTAE